MAHLTPYSPVCVCDLITWTCLLCGGEIEVKSQLSLINLCRVVRHYGIQLCGCFSEVSLTFFSHIGSSDQINTTSFCSTKLCGLEVKRTLVCKDRYMKYQSKCILCMKWFPYSPQSLVWMCSSLTSLYMGMPREVYLPHTGYNKD